MSTDLNTELAAVKAERDALRAERDALAVALEQAREPNPERSGSAEYGAHVTRALIDHAPAVIYVKNLDGRFIVSNRLHAQLLGKGNAEVLGRCEHELLTPEEAAEIEAVTAEVIASGNTTSQEFCLELDGGPRWFLEEIFALKGADGAVFAVAGIATDITRRRDAELAVGELQAQVIAAQASALAELSAPLMQLAPGVIAVPLIGRYDRERGDHMIEVLTQGIVARRARYVILDCTGLREVDTETTSAIARVTRLARMLGAQVVLTGIVPAIAMTLARAEVNLHEVIVEQTMGGGLSRVLSELEKRAG